MSAQIPYQPMGKPKRVSFARMQEILARRSGAVQSPQAKAPEPQKEERKWKRVAASAIESEDGMFRIEKQDQAGTMVYECFRKAPDWWLRFATESSGDAAKARCERCAGNGLR